MAIAKMVSKKLDVVDNVRILALSKHFHGGGVHLSCGRSGATGDGGSLQSRQSKDDGVSAIRRDGRMPLTDQLDALLRAELKKFKPGDRFYTDREVCRKYGISPPVARTVLLRLAGEGLIRREISRGTFVERLPTSKATAMVHPRVAVFCPMTGYCPHSAAVQGIEEICRAQDVDVLIRSNRQEGAGVDLAAMAEMVKSALHNADGVIWVGSILEEIKNWPAALATMAKRLVCINIFARTGRITAVVRDDEASAFALSERLIKDGYRQIGYIGGPAERFSAAARYRGFVRAMQAYGLSLDVPWIVPHTSGMVEDTGRLVLSRWLSMKKLPAALICVTDRMAAAVVSELHSGGVKVPDDVAVAGFDNSPTAETCRPPLTSIDPCFIEIGQMAAKLLLAQLKGDARNGALHWLPGRLVARDSTGATCKSAVVN